MNLINCQECGKIFASAGQQVCPACKESDEKKFKLVKDFLWDNPNSTIGVVSEATGVEEKVIIKFIKENRLQSEGLDIDYSLKCKTCGVEIKSGIYCDRCRNKLVNDLNAPSAKEDDKKDEKGKKSKKMFLANRFKRD